MPHTPGPWDDASKYPDADSVRIFAKAHYIATVGNSDDPRDVTEANARLIAAAPDLLAELVGARHYVAHAISEAGAIGAELSCMNQRLQAIDAVIAKARS